MRIDKVTVSRFVVVCIVAYLLFISWSHRAPTSTVQSSGVNPAASQAQGVLYTGKIYHIFFHSLIVYPELAYDGGPRSQLYHDYMITRDEFMKMLPELYRNNFVLVDLASTYTVNADGTQGGAIAKKPLYLPKGKKPLVISLDDLSYYHSMTGHGFAEKLVLDAQGNVATEIVTPHGETQVTRDGDVVPILDDFVAAHPDFSVGGAKGVIAITGHEGVLGYRTDSVEVASHPQDVELAKQVIARLKSTGWRFASHSYSHDSAFSTGAITLDKVRRDADLWDAEVRPLVGATDIFVGPYGQIFNQGDPRREAILSHGFKIVCGVGADQHLEYFPRYVEMDRADIDGYRLTHDPELLKEFFDVGRVR
ncbi:hypothetical protein EB052_01785 [bacterium]|nr:hypothetical protein [bacterium]